jgi:DNA-binding transcriptional LysR family regulator
MIICYQFMFLEHHVPAADNRPLDLTQLRAVLAVRESGTVTLAAEQLGLSQPAVSRLVAALEDELGFVVFERSRRRMVLSERGAKFLDEAQSALRSMARLAVLAGELRRGSHGLLRVGAIAPLALGLVARAVAIHARRIANITVEIEVLGRQAQLEELRAGRLDIALAAMPFSGSGLRVEPILEADAVCLLRSDHRLAHRAELRPADIADEALVLGRPESIVRQRLDDTFRQSNLAQKVASVADNTPLVMALVSAGVGVAVTHAFPEDALPTNVVTRRFRPRIPFTYAIVTQAGDFRSLAIAEFSNTLRSVAQEIQRASLSRRATRSPGRRRPGSPAER